MQWIKTIRGIYPCKISLSELEKIYSTILFRCRRDALVNKSMIRGFNEQTLDIILETENKYYTMRASNAKYRLIKEAYNLFCKECEA
jgi:DNA-binding LytR/AlgR family response regulator